jgi:V/A-type H+-transporting ATPase subunit I
MSSSDLGPVPMTRVAVVAPQARARDVLVALADTGMMEVEELDGRGDRTELVRLDEEVPDGTRPLVAPDPIDLDEARDRGWWDLVAGEAAIARRRRDMVDHDPAAVLVGWVATADLDDLAQRLAAPGASLVELPRPRRIVPPTRMPESRLRTRVRPLVETYAVVPYEDVDPSLFAGITYVLMFGMMFGDVGHGLVLALLAVLLARSDRPRLASVRRLWVFPFAAGIVAAGFGFLYGEAFGPTGLVPTLWLSPLEEPVRLLVVAIGAGAALIAASLVGRGVRRRARRSSSCSTP